MGEELGKAAEAEADMDAEAGAGVRERVPVAQPMPIKENFYDKIPLTLKQLDIIIALLIAAFVFFFTVGVLRGNGIL